MFLNLVPVHIFTGNATKCLSEEKHKNNTIKSQKTKAPCSNINLSVQPAVSKPWCCKAENTSSSPEKKNKKMWTTLSQNLLSEMPFIMMSKHFWI